MSTTVIAPPGWVQEAHHGYPFVLQSNMPSEVRTRAPWAASGHPRWSFHGNIRADMPYQVETSVPLHKPTSPGTYPCRARCRRRNSQRRDSLVGAD